MCIQIEINKCPTLSLFINSEIDYKKFNHQLDLKSWAIKEALHRSIKNM